MSKRKKHDWFHHYIIHGRDQEGLHSQYIDDTIGRGVYSTQQFWKGDYLLEYRGKLRYDEPDGDDTYIYEFTYRGKRIW